MFVCSTCHQVDKDVHRCNQTFMGHGSFVRLGECDICGKEKPLVCCEGYELVKFLHDNGYTKIIPV